MRADKYWVDALKIRRANWGLIPAPLPYGAPIGKGADRTSKDFWVAYGLEECECGFLPFAYPLFHSLCHSTGDV